MVAEHRSLAGGYELRNRGERDAEYARQRAELHRLTDVGSLLFSDEAVDVLESLQEEVNDIMNHFGGSAPYGFEELAQAQVKAQKAFRAIARKDLR